MSGLISREALIEKFRWIARAQANARVFIAADAWESAACELEKAPTVDAEPVRHGQWITFKDGRGCELRECSQCHYVFRRLHPSIYCPNCGARMDGV